MIRIGDGAISIALAVGEVCICRQQHNDQLFWPYGQTAGHERDESQTHIEEIDGKSE